MFVLIFLCLIKKIIKLKYEMGIRKFNLIDDNIEMKIFIVKLLLGFVLFVCFCVFD